MGPDILLIIAGIVLLILGHTILGVILLGVGLAILAIVLVFWLVVGKSVFVLGRKVLR